jgi:UDP-glucose 4-epimerase
MRVVVTGGAGYIGSVVTEVLLGDGHEVLVVDNLTKGHRDAITEGARLIELDVLDQPRMTRALADFGAEAVVHMAASSLVGESVSDPAKYYRNNLGGGLALLDAMRGAGVPRLVFSSTAAVYGEPARQPIVEDDPQQPTNPYGATKLAFEHALHAYGHAYGRRSSSLRYFNAAGATKRHGERHDPETHLIPLVLDAAAGRRPHVVVFGTDYPTPDGTCVRDYVHVEDLARAHALALGALEGPPQRSHYNLGCGGAGYSVRQVIDAAAAVTGRSIPVVTADRRPGDPAVLVASSDRIKAELGWTPRRQELSDIIASAWDWVERRRDSAAG